MHPGKAKLMMGMVNKTDKLDVHGLNVLQRTGALPGTDGATVCSSGFALAGPPSATHGESIGMTPTEVGPENGDRPVTIARGKRLAATVLAVAISCVLGGCWMGRYAPPKLRPVKAPGPVEDFVRLRKVFRDHGGDLVTREDKVVKWRDTRMFRMYEFKRHTVVIFPYNWQSRGFLRPERFDLIVFAGHIKPDKNPYDAISYERVGDTPRFHNEGIDWHLDSDVLQDVRFEDFRLGMPRKTMIEQQTAFLKEWDAHKDPAVYEVAMECVTGFPDEAWDYRDWGVFRIYFESKKVAWMEFTQQGGPELGAFAIDEPVTPFIAEGEFEIPAEEGRGQRGQERMALP